MDLAAGTTLAGHYRIIRPLGEGGMGGVYLVEDTRTGARLALKEALDDPAASPEERAWARDRFDQEIALMLRLRSVATQAGVPAYEADFSDRGRRYLVMEYIPGDSLEARIDATRAPLPEREVLRWMIDVCRAMEILHRQRPPIILRDLKPGNIMLTPAGRARVIDFGIARTYKAGQLSNTENLGTIAYASPEHHGQGQTDARSDIYSLGATMYHALTGREPQPLDEPAPGALIRLNHALTPPTEAVVARAMRLDPERRYQTAAEMRRALEERLAALTPRPRLTSPALTARQSIPTRPAAAPTKATAQPMAKASPAANAGPLCPRCGRRNRVGARFCARDGAPLTAVASTVAPRPVRVEAAPPTHPIASQATTHALRATEAFARGRYHQTIQQGQAAINAGATETGLLLTVARAYEQVGRMVEAAETYERAAQAHPDAATWLAAARCRRALGQLTEAQLALSRTRQMAPDDAEASYLLGLVSLELGQLAQAEGELRDTLRLAPTSAPALVALARVEEARGQTTEALERLRAAVVADPALGEARWRLGRALLERRRFTEAIRELERATQLDPAAADAFAALGLAYHATGNRQRAREMAQTALRLDSGHVEARALLKSL